jgi:rubrerythrin
MPENAVEIAPNIQEGYFSKWDGKKWAEIAKPETAEECEKIGAISHYSQTAHDRELRAIFQAVTQNSETHEVKLNDGFWSVVKKPEKSAEEKAAEDRQNRIAELKRMLSETDYIALKIAEGSATKKEYSEKIAQRQAWRTEINDLEAELENVVSN